MHQQKYEVTQDWAETAKINAEKYALMYRRSVEDPDGFWREEAQRIAWIRPFTNVKNTWYDAEGFGIKWFEDGTLNLSANCLDLDCPDDLS